MCILLRQELADEFVRLFSLYLQFISPLFDQVLQVGAVLLQHAQHGVYDVGFLALINSTKLQEEEPL